MEAGRFDEGATQEGTRQPMRLPLVGDQQFSLERPKTGVGIDIGGLLIPSDKREPGIKCR